MFVGTVGSLWDPSAGNIMEKEPWAPEREVQIRALRYPWAKEHHDVDVVVSTLDDTSLPYGLEQRGAWGQEVQMKGYFCHSKCGVTKASPGWWPQNKSWRQMGVPGGCSSIYTQLMCLWGPHSTFTLRTMSPVETGKIVISKAVQDELIYAEIPMIPDNSFWYKARYWPHLGSASGSSPSISVGYTKTLLLVQRGIKFSPCCHGFCCHLPSSHHLSLLVPTRNSKLT